MHFSEIKWAKVSEEWLIHKIVVDTEVEGVLPRFRRGLVTDPVQSLANDFYGLVVRG